MSIVLGPEPTQLPERVFTAAGWMSLDDEYIPRVIAGENLRAHFEAKAALAIAARTYLLRSMRDRPTFGRLTPIPSGEKFQVFAKSATYECGLASSITRGVVLRYRGRLILANHVAGAPWNADGSLGPDPTNTERFVTYNAGRSGQSVKPTSLSLRSHPGNRGCFGQNGSDWLAKQGYGHLTILRYFYGEDIEFHEFGKTGVTTSAAKPVLPGILALAALGLMLKRR